MSNPRMLTVLAVCACLAGAARAEENVFPFVVSYDAPQNVTNVGSWLARPAGAQGFVRVADGRLHTDAGPIRFWATNMCFEACFPSHEEAQRLAARLARLGINCVRLHHMDARSIWGKSGDLVTIDPEKLDRLDDLIAELKKQGIYVNINLHVSRWLGPKEGFPEREGRPKYDKGLGNFEPRMIELQKKYARDLLCHVNRYTGKAYAEEPAVAVVEISNEDALFTEWHGGHLDDLPEPYAATFRRLWNAWLVKKYGGTERLRKAWNAGRRALGEELLRNVDLAQKPENTWRMERDDQVKAAWSVEAGGPQGQRVLRVTVERKGRTSWRPQISQSGFSLRKGEPYTLTLWARAEKPAQMSVNCMMAHEPWRNLGLLTRLKLDRAWREFRQCFVAAADDPQCRITLTGLEPGTYEFAGVSLRPGGIIGLEDDQRLEDQSVPVLAARPSATEPARRDFIDFLWQTETDYWHGMYRFLKQDLKVRSLVAGTQLSYGPMHVQAGLDFIDAHSYWQHPHFPHKPWDPKDWTVRNVALVNTPGGTLASLACRRVARMAYSVSEYNHPAPLEFRAEGFPMIAAFGAFQAWDAVYSFTYSHSTSFEPRRIEGFFDIKSDPVKIVHMPACAAMFLRGDVAPARKLIAVPVSEAAERAKLYETLSPRSITANEFGLDPRMSLVNRVAMDPQGGAATPVEPLPEDARVFCSDTGQIRWDVSKPGAGAFTVDSPRSKLFTGFVAGRRFRLGDVELAVGPTRRDWATVSLVAIDGDAMSRPGRILIAATGMAGNTGAELEQLGGDLVTLRNRWGTEPVLCEGVPAEIALAAAADRVTLYALDESGTRRAEIPVGRRNGRAVLPLGPQHRTLWYEAVVR